MPALCWLALAEEEMHTSPEIREKNGQTSLTIREINFKTITSIALGNIQKPDNTNVKKDFKK